MLIIPTYNLAEIIGRAIKSVFDRDYPDPEILIVVADLSQDNTQEVVRAVKDQRVKYVFRQKKGEQALPAIPGLNWA